ncbi:MAG TPA: phosphocholine cytidylyltransferase family protein [Thermodesulfobacteriota bacterium]|nr:phosphocholine cytidylyltransferase family protein [Thermodesulfobacteriota bacterium]
MSRMDKNIRHGLIIAAGRGVRFGTATDSRPKPLIEVAGVSLLSRTLLTARQAGIDCFTVVTGYCGELLEAYLRQEPVTGIRVRCLLNEEWDRPNGLSVLKAKDYLQVPFVLLMADHLFESQILKNLLSAPLPSGHCRLAVDFHPEEISDLADATKVAVQDGRVTDIGKEIQNYNAIDTGIFLCSPGIFNALETAISRGKESLSDGIRELAYRQCMEAMSIGDLFWQDVDDEASRMVAEKRLLGMKGGALPNGPE